MAAWRRVGEPSGAVRGEEAGAAELELGSGGRRHLEQRKRDRPTPGTGRQEQAKAGPRTQQQSEQAEPPVPAACALGLSEVAHSFPAAQAPLQRLGVQRPRKPFPELGHPGPGFASSPSRWWRPLSPSLAFARPLLAHLGSPLPLPHLGTRASPPSGGPDSDLGKPYRGNLRA